MKSKGDVYKETKVRIACWKRKQRNEYCLIKREAEEVLKIAKEVSSGIGEIDLNG